MKCYDIAHLLEEAEKLAILLKTIKKMKLMKQVNTLHTISLILQMNLFLYYVLQELVINYENTLKNIKKVLLKMDDENEKRISE